MPPSNHVGQVSEVHPDLQREREGCPFSKEEIVHLLDGGREKTEQRRSIEKLFLNAKVLEKEGKVAKKSL